MVLPAFCYKCRRRITSLFLTGICVDCDAALTETEREAVPQEMWVASHSGDFLQKWPTPAAFDDREK